MVPVLVENDQQVQHATPASGIGLPNNADPVQNNPMQHKPVYYVHVLDPGPPEEELKSAERLLRWGEDIP
ncbi:hypothetical protein HYH03_014124 [Edaphochlamys debaryana]|uniref:Uncharacterized protein n=1 Tax=Edaphochlamys debaryana TaxID=47281 RepID=A0A835XQT6_9CHLO|nr:hypothetical protein HYH03_014124 [Edaphochlamys debaryana]|eukprot:KAG2487283.1 hypothetical protein HYH03_014124 [Edaphochlamys debaryana]